MKSIKTAAAAAAIICSALATPASAATVVADNPVNTYNFTTLGDGSGGNQTQFVGETFTSPLNGLLTDFQFTLNTSSLNKVYGAVYAWDGSKPTSLLWQSQVISNPTGLLDFSPTGLSVNEGQKYVAFLSTYGIAGVSGGATLGSCLSCTSVNPLLGTLAYANVYPSDPPIVWASPSWFDATFSVTFSQETSASPTPLPAALPLFAAGATAFGLFGLRNRRKRTPAQAA